MSYAYSVRFRITGLAGPATVVDASAWGLPVVVKPQDEPIVNRTEMIDFSLRQVPYGVRRRYVMTFKFFPGDEAYEAQLVQALAAALDESSVVEVSIDGGTTYREALLDDSSDGPVDNKMIGVEYHMTWTCVDLVVPTARLGGAG